MEALGRVELPTNGLGNRCSIHLSYRAVRSKAIIAWEIRAQPPRDMQPLRSSYSPRRRGFSHIVGPYSPSTRCDIPRRM